MFMLPASCPMSYECVENYLDSSCARKAIAAGSLFPLRCHVYDTLLKKIEKKGRKNTQNDNKNNWFLLR